MKPYQLVLGAAAIEITQEPVVSNLTELLTIHEIVAVSSVYNKKPNNAEVRYLTPTTPFSIGDTIVGVTSGATGVITAFNGTVGIILSDVVGTFVDGENINYGTGISGAGTAASPGTWNGVTGATSGAGIGITFDVTDTTGVYDTIAIATPGIGYNIGDTVTILGTSLGGATPANDLVITITGDNAVVDGDVIPMSFDGEWTYPYPTMTVISITMADQSKVELELQECTNQATWNGGAFADLQQAISDINAWL